METVLFREATFDTGKVVLNYAEGPESGFPLVMLHGGSGRWQLYSGMLAELLERSHVYAPDLRGHGKSGWVPWGYTIRDGAVGLYHPGLCRGYWGILAGGQWPCCADGTLTGRHHCRGDRESLP